MGEQIKSSLLITRLQQIYSYFIFHLPATQSFISAFYLYYSPLHVAVITRNILITIIRFARYYLLRVSSNTFMTDSQYLGTIQI